MKSVALTLGIFFGILVIGGCSAADDGGETATQDDAVNAVAPLGPEPAGNATRFPVVLVHGFLGQGEGFASFHPLVTEALEKDGHAVFRAKLPPIGAVSDRASALGQTIDRVLAETKAKKVNLVAHSMGGLDARAVVSELGYGDRVASVTTISTPHRGSHIADVSLALVSGQSEDALGVVAKIMNTSPDSADLKGALRDLSEAHAPKRNAAHPDDARVYYQSWAGVSSVFAIPNPADAAACDGKLLAHARRADSMGPVLAPAAPFVGHGIESNDGFVSVASAKWGTFRGCIPADHADEIGVFKRTSLDPHTGFDFVRFHRNVAFDLAARGF